jgi:hypothetical protein
VLGVPCSIRCAILIIVLVLSTQCPVLHGSALPLLGFVPGASGPVLRLQIEEQVDQSACDLRFATEAECEGWALTHDPHGYSTTP